MSSLFDLMMKSITEFKIRKLSLSGMSFLPKRRMLTRLLLERVDTSRCKMFEIFCNRVVLKLVYDLQSRRKCLVSSLVLHTSHNPLAVSWKPCLYLWAFKGLSPNLSIVKYLMWLWSLIPKYDAFLGLILFKIRFLKISFDLASLILLSNLFQSLIVIYD